MTTSSKFPDKARGSNTGRPINVLFDLLGSRWTLRILWELRNAETLNFRELQARCEQVSPTVLNQRLKKLRELRLVEHESGAGYRLSDDGQELGVLVLQMNQWAEDWAGRFENEN